MNKVRDFYYLTKPGIIRGNLITATAGFLLAAKGDIDLLLFLSMLGGLGLVVASACVFNNYLDRDIDAKMSRTKKRALVAGTVSTKNALIFATSLGWLGSLILAVQTNLVAWGAAMLGLFFYVIVYGIGKRRTVWGTVIGSISGAVPPVVGYTAVTGNVSLVAIVLFLILVFWQMPHFYAIAMFRLKDYRAAGIPVLPAVSGMRATKVQIIMYIYAFIAATALLNILGTTGDVYLFITLLLGTFWLWTGLKGFKVTDDERWARQMFRFSLLVITGWSIMISIDHWLP